MTDLGQHVLGWLAVAIFVLLVVNLVLWGTGWATDDRRCYRKMTRAYDKENA